MPFLAREFIAANKNGSSAGMHFLLGNPNAEFTGVSIDTRTLKPGDLFFAISGTRNDGHDHLEEAWSGERGQLKEFLQGLIHLSVGMYHLAASNAEGAVHLLERALARLESFPGDAYGVDLPPLLTRASTCLSKARRMLAGETVEWVASDIPRIALLGADRGEGKATP